MFGFLKKKGAVTSPPPPSGVMGLSPHPLRGLTNFGMFEVHGLNPKTGRQNKRIVEALSDQDALERAKRTTDLVEPFTVQEVQRPMATERQIAYGDSLGLKITPDLSMVDASAMICRENDGDVALISGADVEAASLAGVVMSALAGRTFYRSAMKNADRVK